MTVGFNDIWAGPGLVVHKFEKTGTLFETGADLTGGKAARVFAAILLAGDSPTRAECYLWDATSAGSVLDPDAYLRCLRYRMAGWERWPTGVRFSNGITYYIDGDTRTELYILYRLEE